MDELPVVVSSPVSFESFFVPRTPGNVIVS